jgi:hypothetical protein
LSVSVIGRVWTGGESECKFRLWNMALLLRAIPGIGTFGRWERVSRRHSGNDSGALDATDIWSDTVAIVHAQHDHARLLPHHVKLIPITLRLSTYRVDTTLMGNVIAYGITDIYIASSYNHPKHHYKRVKV